MAEWTSAEMSTEVHGQKIVATPGDPIIKVNGQSWALQPLRLYAQALNEAADIAEKGEPCPRWKVGQVIALEENSVKDMEEPPIGTILKDHEGDHWKRFAAGWRSRRDLSVLKLMDGTENHASRASRGAMWGDVLIYRPLTIIELPS